MFTRDQEVGLDLPDGRDEAPSIGLYGGGNLRGGGTRGDGGEQRAGGDRNGGQPTNYPGAPHKNTPSDATAAGRAMLPGDYAPRLPTVANQICRAMTLKSGTALCVIQVFPAFCRAATGAYSDLGSCV